MNEVILNNGVRMPSFVMGTSVDDRKGTRKKLIRDMCSIVDFAVENGVRAFDTSREYENESILGNVFSNLFKCGLVKREEVFITTKVGNRHQRTRNMRKQIEISLKELKLDYIDLWLLHWPLPGFYLENWIDICEIYNEGLVKAIGIANCRERHIDEIKNTGINILPHVIQIEYHPFRTVNNMRLKCNEKNIQIEAYSANCLMLPFVKANKVLNTIADKHEKSITQIMMRWHIQQGTIPIFSTMNKEHLINNISIFDFELSDVEMNQIFELDCDYKFHPESINCPGY